MKESSSSKVKNDEYNSLWKKACAHAKSRGFGDEAEDFASDLVLRRLEGKSLKQSIEQSFIDYSDQLRANKRVLGSPSGYCSKNVKFSIDQPKHTSNDDGPTVGDSLGSFRDDLEFKRDNAFHHSVLKPKERMIFEMYFTEGLSLREIGDEFKVTESRASQWLTKIKEKVSFASEGAEILSAISSKIGSDEARRFALRVFVKNVKG